MRFISYVFLGGKDYWLARPNSRSHIRLINKQ